MTDYFTSKNTTTNKKLSFPYEELYSDGESVGESEINILNDNKSQDLSYKNINLNKQTIAKPLSDLGKALSETISKLTRDKRFKCGDKVELILEIELVKSQTVNKSGKVGKKHSIVEVTIIQHLVPENQPLVKPMEGDVPIKTVPYRLLGCNSESDTASRKRQKWFERVIYNQRMRCDVGSTTRNVGNMGGDNYKGRYSTVKYLNTKWYEDGIDRKNGRSNYGTEKVYPKPRLRRKLRSKGQFFQHESTGKFLPASEVSRNYKMEDTFSELKENVDQYDLVQNSNIIRKKRGPIPALGKLVSNILVGVIDKANTNFKNSLRNSDRNTHLTNNIRQNNIASKRDEFCCIVDDNYKQLYQEKLRHLNGKSKLKSTKNPIRTETVSLKRNDKLYKCGLDYNRNNEFILPSALPKTMATDIKKKEQRQDKSAHKHCIQIKTEQKEKEEHNLSATSSDHSWVLKIEKKNKKPKHQNKGLKNNQNNTSLNNMKENWKTEETEKLFFDGKSLTLGTELRRKIETLIVNELQNLALNEGMECDISPLSSSFHSDIHYDLENPVSEVQSFYCEIDLTDTIEKIKDNIARVNGHKKDKEKQENYVAEVKNDNVNKKIDNETAKKANPRSNFTTNNCKLPANERKLNFEVANKMDKNKFELTYINPATTSWSKESSKTFNINHKEVTEIKNTSNQKTGFIKQLQSNDTVWKNSHYIDNSETNSSQIITESEQTKTSTSNENQTSDNTNEYCSNIEIELDVQGLENILEQARANGFNDKFLINATRNKKKKRKEKSCSVNRNKNTSSYTETILSEAAKKLENHLKRNTKNKNKK